MGSYIMNGGNGGDSLYGEDGDDDLTGGSDFVFDQLVINGVTNAQLHAGDFILAPAPLIQSLPGAPEGSAMAWHIHESYGDVAAF